MEDDLLRYHRNVKKLSEVKGTIYWGFAEGKGYEKNKTISDRSHDE
jgi:hypothetical protein